MEEVNKPLGGLQYWLSVGLLIDETPRGNQFNELYQDASSIKIRLRSYIQTNFPAGVMDNLSLV